MLQLRDYQQGAVDATITAILNKQSPLCVLPTGTGKTVIFGHTAKRTVEHFEEKRILVIAHREELIFQARDKIESVTGWTPEIEMADMKASNGSFWKAKCVVASVQTLNSGRRCSCRERTDDTVGGHITGCPLCIGGIVRRMQKFDPNDFCLVITDEAHHATAESYGRIYEYFRQNPECRFMGVTATPDRADEAALGKIFDTVAYEYELPQAISDGWLVPISQEYVQCDDIDFSQVRTTAGDLNGADLESIMLEEEAVHQVVTPTIEIAGDRTVLFFASSVAHAEIMASVLNRHKERSALCITGTTPTDMRRAALKSFARGNYQYLCGCGVFLEGFDEPRIDVVAMARPTKSRALYAQAIGRGTRPILPPRGATPEERRAEISGSKKPGLLVLDFVGNSGRHKLISTADILGGNYDDAVVDLAVANARKEGGQRDMSEELANAAEELRQRLIDEKRRKIKANGSKYSRQEVSAFDVFDLVPQRERGWNAGKSPTAKQLETLVKFGVSEKEIASMSIGKASQLLGELIRRRQANLCSYKQAKLLQRFGQPVDVGFAEAGRLIDAIARNGWRPIPVASAKG